MTHGERMQKRRNLLSDLSCIASGASLQTYVRNKLARLGLTTRGERRDTLTDVGRQLLDEGVHSPWFETNEERLSRTGNIRRKRRGEPDRRKP